MSYGCKGTSCPVDGAPSAHGGLSGFPFKSLRDLKKHYDFIIIGGGVYGTSFAHRILTKGKELNRQYRVLVLEKGPYLIPDHVQNLPTAYQNLPNVVGVTPWGFTGSQSFMPQIPYLGGRGLFWNAWVPQPDEVELLGWNRSLYNQLRTYWYEVYNFLGRRYSLTTAGNIDTPLSNLMRDRLFAGLPSMDTARFQTSPSSLDSAMAAGSGVSSKEFAKFCPVSILLQDMNDFPDQLDVVCEAEVDQLILHHGQVVALKVKGKDGKMDKIECDEGAASRVILACNTLEAAFLMQRSDPTHPLVGKNLGGHVRSMMKVRVPASQFAGRLGNANGLQVGAFYLPSRAIIDEKQPDQDRLMHTHVSVVYNPNPDRDQHLLYRVLPDPLLLPDCDQDHVLILLQSLGEFVGKQCSDSWNFTYLKDNKPTVNVEIRPQDELMWKQLDQITLQISNAMTKGDSHVEYYHDQTQSWSSERPATIRYADKGVHEAGTLWMGDDPKTSVTDVYGKVHTLKNVFGLGSMIFPRPGSFNPTMMGVAQCFCTADYLMGVNRAAK